MSVILTSIRAINSIKEFKSIRMLGTVQESPQPKKDVKFVRFMEPDQNEVNEVENHEGNPNDIWYSESEQETFLQRDRKMARLLLHLTPAELEIKTGNTVRGLEHAMEATGNAIYQRQRKSVSAVIATQKLFQSQQRDGCDSIARVYGLIGERAIESAKERGQDDERFVQDHVYLPRAPTNRVFEKRDERPPLMRRQIATRCMGCAVAAASA